MRDHVRILAYLNLVFGALGLLAALVVFLVCGGVIGIVGFARPADIEAWHVAMPVLGLICIVVVAILFLLSLPGLIAGIGLLKFRPWARILGIVLSAMNLLNVPFGTALGIYGLWVLLQQETEQLFAAGG